MGLFTRNNEAVEGVRGDDVPFETLKRSPRNVRKPRAPVDGNRDAPPPLDPAETAKTRARRRLIGAVALATAAVVFVPMLFDRTPVATSDDIALSIPDRDTPFEGRKGVPDPSRGPLKSTGDLPAVSPSATQAAEPQQTPATAARTQPAAEPEPGTPEPKAETKPEAKAETKSGAKAEAKAAVKGEPRAANPLDKPKPTVAEERAKPAPAADDPKALAALEGRPEAGGAAAAASSAAGGERSFAVQVAAYSSSDKARTMRDSLVANGLRSYTESVSTAQGLRTRVRLGPFASRADADHAKQKLKTMKLDGSVVPL